MRAHASWGSLNDVMLVFMNQDAYDKFRLSKEDYNAAVEASGILFGNATSEALKKLDEDKMCIRDRCTELRVTVPETMKYFCTSETIALYIQKYVQYRKRKVFFGATGKFADLVPSIVKHNTEKYLVPMSDVHNDEIKTLLDKNKIQHTEVVMYRTVSNDFTPEEEFDYDMLLFFSPAGINSLMKNFPEFDQKEIAIGCFGPATAKAVKDAGLRLDLEAPTVEAPSMTAALDMFIRERNKD